jgi:riboflavin transporter FmnP
MYKNCICRREESEFMNQEQTNTTRKTRNAVLIAMFGAVSMVLMLLEFPIPIAPPFMKIDLSDLPAILGTFMIGPGAGAGIAALKIVLKLVFKGTDTAFVGELSNFVCALMYILPSYFFYHRKKTKKRAAISLMLGTLSVSILAVFVNYFIMFPLYSKLYGMPLKAIIAMGTAVNSHINGLFSMMLIIVFPFNILKYGIVSVITFIAYKRLKRALIH